MELLQYWRVIKKRLWLILLLGVIGAAATAYSSLREPAQYESTATLLLNPAVPSALVPYVQSQVASNLADSYTELMHSQSFADQVVKELHFSIGKETVAAAITGRLVPNTLFYKISARASTPDQAEELVNGVVKVFLSANEAQQKAQTDAGGGSVRNAMRDRLDTKLKYLDDLIKSYQDHIKDLQGQPSSKDRNDELLQSQSQLIILEQTETETIVALANVTDNSTPLNTALVIDPALPGGIVASKAWANVLAGLAGFMVLGVALAFLLDYLDNTVRSPEYLEQVLGLTPMAVVGLVGQTRGSAYGGRSRRKGAKTAAVVATEAASEGPSRLNGRKLITLEHPRSPDSESFRVLRTNIQFSSLSTPIRSLVVTSAGPGEGKSFTAANLAIVLAQTGKRVILVDTDLRRPSLHKLFALPNMMGFTNLVLNTTTDRGGAIQPIPEVPNLLVVTSGPVPPNPSELLDSLQAIHVMDQLSQAADIVIYDTPPATVVTDPAILATRVDGVVLVIKSGATRRDMVTRVKKILHGVGVKALIPVLNQASIRDIGGYYYYYQGYGSLDAVPAAARNGNGYHANGMAAPAIPIEQLLPVDVERGESKAAHPDA
ncbi:MAG TPA: polysaccharide biosynthesis tyrosine autokinase [Chloroflexia bacterium]|nr:polysaccharide biosynthesis tyrosine autokinase [Chloroflexia bacterium]